MVLASACSLAAAQDVLLTGHVRRVVLHPSGGPECPPVCPAPAARNPDGSNRVCISNDGGCQIMDVDIDHVYRGAASGMTRRFTSRIGEFGPSFPVTTRQLVVSERGGVVSWSEATERDGRIYVDPPHPRHAGGVLDAMDGNDEQVSLDDVLARWDARR